MIKELLDITIFFKDLIFKGSELNKTKIKAFFDNKISKYYSLFNEVHNDYILSLNNYKESIIKLDNIDTESFDKIIEQINNDMLNSFNKRSSLMILNILKDINRGNKIDRFYQKSNDFILAVNEYLLNNWKNKITNKIDMPYWPGEIDESITDIAQIDFNKIYPENHCYNIPRNELIHSLEKSFNDCMKLKDSENLQKHIKSQIIKIINNTILELDKRYLKVRIAYEELENIIIC